MSQSLVVGASRWLAFVVPWTMWIWDIFCLTTPQLCEKNCWDLSIYVMSSFSQVHTWFLLCVCFFLVCEVIEVWHDHIVFCEAYAELLSQFKTINSIPIPLDPKNNFSITLQELRREIVGRGLSVLLSNPCNPTGQLIEGEELKNWVRIARETQCSLVLDEIYSRYIYTQRMSPTDATWRMVSAAQFVDDVNQDPVIILDGLTKCWRMPGLRICWIVAPKSATRQTCQHMSAFFCGWDCGKSEWLPVRCRLFLIELTLNWLRHQHVIEWVPEVFSMPLFS